MNDLTFLQAVVLGFVQGLTEFLPVSSKSHLAITQRLMGLRPDSDEMIFFDLLLHVATLAAVVVVFREPLVKFLSRLALELRSNWPARRRYAWRIALLGMAATIPTGVIGITCKDFFESAFAKPRWTGFGLWVTATLLVVASILPRGRRRWRDFAFWQAGFVGLAQGAALLPGISRSGSTICAALFCGLRRPWAAQFSFLIAFPAILGGTLIKLKDLPDGATSPAPQLHWAPMALGCFVSFLAGIVALRLLLSAVRKAKLFYFAGYCAILGTLLVAGLI
ncbi:MAG: undecaprenyl-diphosphate phosphatase [Planctomycetota bacterium]|mgnify:CR=1 FL=1